MSATLTGSEGTTIAKTFTDATNDWSNLSIAGSSEFNGLVGDVTVTINYAITGDNCIIKPNANWNYFLAEELHYYASPEIKEDYTVAYCIKPDGTLYIGDTSLIEVSFNLTVKEVEDIVSNGKGLASKLYGVYLTKAILTEVE